MRNFQHLAMFRSAARLGSFTEAAAAEKVSVAVVSRAIARLEEELDCRLFNRTTRRLKLTAAGELFLQEISGAIERVENAKDLLQEQIGSASGSLRLAAPSIFARQCLVPTLQDFLDLHPQISIDLDLNDTGEDPIAGGYDIVFQIGEVARTGYISRRLGRMEILLAASPAYFARHGVPTEVEALSSHLGIGVRASAGRGVFPWNLKNIATGKHYIHKVKARFYVGNQVDVALPAALEGLGIIAAEVRTVLPYLQTGQLKVVLPEYRDMSSGEVTAIYPHRDHIPFKVRALLDFSIHTARKRLVVEGFDAHAFAA
ncbi:DNA-binding transcriptional LysR family regulator [Sphingomonas zeicaulis]|uniref:LysR family transcriptional regulator n=1 Tax=Sphingomonas zeicaulis TaxID=1632740 RepID=UPI003D24ACD4